MRLLKAKQDYLKTHGLFAATCPVFCEVEGNKGKASVASTKG